MSANLFQSELSESVDSLTGKLPYKLTNDYIFRVILQESSRFLKGFISALLHLPPEDVHSVVINNPIELGRAIDSKTFIIDVHVILNASTLIHLEMQVINKGYWPERSLSYLCRSFDNLNRGQEYSETKPVIHISILNYTLFPQFPEFYASYLLMNQKNHNIYSDKLLLSVLDLNQIELAVDEDKEYQLHYWAALFKAETWEELKMIASKNEYMSDVCPTLYKVSAEENIRLQCEALEDYYREQRTIQSEMDRMHRELAALQQKINEAELKANEAELKTNKAELKANEAELKANEAELKANEAELKSEAAKSKLREKESLIEKLQAQLSELQKNQQ